MRVYIATSWANERSAIRLANILRGAGHEVDCFCEERPGREVFHYKDVVPEGRRLEFDPMTFMAHPRVRLAYEEDRKWLDWAQVVVLIVPCGEGSHMEAGYIKGKGGKLFIWGQLVAGAFTVMYGFADGMYPSTELNNLLHALAALDMHASLDKEAG